MSSASQRRPQTTTAILVVTWILLLAHPEKAAGQWGGTFPSDYNRGVITSPYYPLDYMNNLTVTWNINAGDDHLIKLTFIPPFVLEECYYQDYYNNKLHCYCGYDYVKVYDGNDDDGNDVITSCGPKLPSEYVSSTSSLRIVFKSDPHVVGKGFSATWEKVSKRDLELAKPCHQEIHGTEGQLDLTGDFLQHPNSNAKKCTWNISVPAGHFILLELNVTSDLDSNGEDAINDDTRIEITDVFHDTLTNNTRGVWHRADLPPVLKSFGSNLVITIHSDAESIIGHQYSAQWQANTDCGDVFTADHGSFMYYKDNDGTSSGTTNQSTVQSCTWDITNHKPFFLNFSIRLEQMDCQNIQILEYSKENNQFYPGPDCCDDNQNVTSQCTVKSSSPTLRLVYQPGNNTQGFHATWHRGCGQTFDASNIQTGNFSSPYYGIDYPPSQNCDWVIETSKYHVVRLSFQSLFDIESSNDGQCAYDYVEVFESIPEDNSNVTSLGRYCGKDAPAQVISSTNRMVVRFHSDQAKSGKGFSAVWDTTCGDVLTSDQGTLTSPLFPHPYPHGIDCRWEIRVTPGHVIRLAFTSRFDLEDDSRCEWDFLEIYDYTPNGSRVLRGRWCGQDRPPLLTSSSSRMLLAFHSDGDKNGQGFQAEWKSDKAIPVCGQVFNSPNGTLTSPGHPNPYPHNLDCRWEIHVTAGHMIRLEFDVLDLEMDSDGCAYDSLEVQDVMSNSTLVSQGGKWCSVREIPIFYSMASVLVVTLRTDQDKSGQGFSATWKSMDEGCGGTLTSEAGHVMSPNFPSNYNEQQECRWEISPPTRADANNNLTLHFHPSFDLESHRDCVWDYLEIHQGDAVLGRWCGTNIPPDVTTSGQPLVVVFRSDKSHTHTGFFASWKTS